MGILESAAQSPLLAAASTTNYLDTITGKIRDFLNTALPYVWIIAAIALAGVGIMCIVGSEKSKEAARSKALYIVVGVGVVLGAMYLASTIANLLNIGSFSG